MTDKKKIGQLSNNELKEVKGGIPYEKPQLFELSTVSQTCSSGTLCETGLNGNCAIGTTCATGSIGPNPDIEPG